MECWKQFDDYAYEVSNLGNVRKLGKTSPLKPIPNGKYRYVVITKGPGQGGFWKAHFIHRLVAQLFVPNPDGLPQVNHIDNDKDNNAASNLEWVSAKANARKAVETGATATGEQRSTAKYTNDQIAKVRALHAAERKTGRVYKHGVEFLAYLDSIAMPLSYAKSVVAGRKRRHG